MTTQGGSTHPDNMFYGWIQNIKYYTKSLPTVALSSSVSSMKVSNSSVVTITASFSESMSASPTLSLTGIVSDALMSSTASDSVWTYTWTVSGSTVTSTTATVSERIYQVMHILERIVSPLPLTIQIQPL